MSGLAAIFAAHVYFDKEIFLVRRPAAPLLKNLKKIKRKVSMKPFGPGFLEGIPLTFIAYEA